MSTTTRITLRGEYRADHMRDDRAGSRLGLVIDTGRIYDADLYDTPMVPRAEAQLHPTDDGMIRLASNRYFWPDEASRGRLAAALAVHNAA